MKDQINKRVLYVIIPIFILISAGCADHQVNDVIQENDKLEVQTEKLVNENLAKYTATYFANEVNFSFQDLIQGVESKRKGEQKEVETVLTLKDSNQRAALYLINYKDGGFVIISGDKTVDPILAYSDKNHMPVEIDEHIPGGLALWITNNVKGIAQKREEQDYTIEENMDREWKLILNSDPNNPILYNIEPPDEPGCTPTSNNVGPLMQTEWGQSYYGFNNYAPDYGCSTTYNGRAHAGCVAVAMAQVVRYHESPYTWYDWSSMPDLYGNNEVSQLMYDLAGWVNMDWGCSVSEAENNDIVPALHNLGYNSAHQINYENTNNYEDVRDDLDEGLPVIFTGFEKEFIAGIPYRGEGHAWVADGYLSGTLCPSGNTYLKFHMNWGWGGDYNGYYSLSNFNPGNSDYDYKSKVIIDIEP